MFWKQGCETTLYVERMSSYDDTRNTFAHSIDISLEDIDFSTLDITMNEINMIIYIYQIGQAKTPYFFYRVDIHRLR